jgi:hypothetical protein
VRVLLISGRNNHDWQTTTPKITSILEESGRFVVEIEEHPELLTAERLRPFQVVLSNWNAFGPGPSVSWSQEAKESYIQFVEQGGGHVVVHAGSASFADWKEYQRLTLATWKIGQTTHGRPSAFTVSIGDEDHPVTRGLQDFDYFGELWERAGLQEGVTVLASARSSNTDGAHEEPVAVVGTFGDGRSFTLLLGHNAIEMNNPGFEALLVRGTYWAATGEVPQQRLQSERSTISSSRSLP